MRSHPLIDGVAPDWATGWGCDEFGVFAEIEVGEITQRLRWLPPGERTLTPAQHGVSGRGAGDERERPSHGGRGAHEPDQEGRKIDLLYPGPRNNVRPALEREGAVLRYVPKLALDHALLHGSITLLAGTILPVHEKPGCRETRELIRINEDGR